MKLVSYEIGKSPNQFKCFAIHTIHIVR